LTLQAIDGPGDSEDIQEEGNRLPVWTTRPSRRGGGVAGPPASISLGFDVAACGRSLVILSVESGDGKDGVKAQQERGAGLALSVVCLVRSVCVLLNVCVSPAKLCVSPLSCVSVSLLVFVCLYPCVNVSDS